MRVIRTEGSFDDAWIPRLCTHPRGQPYAILSHRWSEDANDEVLYADIEEIDRISSAQRPQINVIKNPQYVNAQPSDKVGFSKLKGAAMQAVKLGYDYVWVDSCCIDKSSSAELSEAINSMWSWYRDAKVCLAYLADVAIDRKTKDLAKSEWWTRGWTLQELLAPSELTFFSTDWKVIGKKKYMDLAISEITGISPNVINGTSALGDISIAQRMSWASTRTTTRMEDTAYCLMGIFNVNMPLLYGEGERAFLRLQLEIMKGSSDESLFAWDTGSHWHSPRSSLLAPQLSAFSKSQKVVRYEDDEGQAPFSMTNKGISITLRLLPVEGLLGDTTFAADLHCGSTDTGDSFRIYLRKFSTTSEQYVRIEMGFNPTPLSDTGSIRSIWVKNLDTESQDYAQTDFRHNMRLLQVLPTKDHIDIRCRVITAHQKTARYTVLSYCSDDDNPRKKIRVVNGEELEVCASLYHFLQKASVGLRDDLFWVYDFNRTRFDSVFSRFSREILSLDYLADTHDALSNATSVVMWMPESSIDTAIRSLKVTSGMDFDTKSLETVTASPYWRRMSTIVEIVVAQKMMIETQNHSMALDTWRRIYHHGRSQARLHAGSEQAYSRMDQMLQLTECKNSTRDIDSCGNRRQSYQPRVKLEMLLQAAQSSTPMRASETVDLQDLVRASGLTHTNERLGKFTMPIERFFYVVRRLGPDCTTTILPRLLEAAFGFKPETIVRERERFWDFSRFAWISYHLPAYLTTCLTDIDGRLIHTPPLNPSAFDHNSGYLALHPISNGGLLFTKHPRNAFYVPSGLYLRQGHTGMIHRKDLPSQINGRFSRIFGLLDFSERPEGQLRLIADVRGVLALTLCLPWPGRALPPVFDLVDPTELFENKTEECAASEIDIVHPLHFLKRQKHLFDPTDEIASLSGQRQEAAIPEHAAAQPARSSMRRELAKKLGFLGKRGKGG